MYNPPEYPYRKMAKKMLLSTRHYFTAAGFISLLLTFFACKQSENRHTSEQNITAIYKDGMVLIEGGTFYIGTDEDLAYPAEKPAVKTTVNSFWMDET